MRKASAIIAAGIGLSPCPSSAQLLVVSRDLGPARLAGANHDLAVCVQHLDGRIGVADARATGRRWEGVRWVPGILGTSIRAGGLADDGTIGAQQAQGGVLRLGRFVASPGYEYSGALAFFQATTPANYHWMDFVGSGSAALGVNPGDTWFIVRIGAGGQEEVVHAAMPPGATVTLARGSSPTGEVGGAAAGLGGWYGVKWRGDPPSVVYSLEPIHLARGYTESWITGVDGWREWDCGWARTSAGPVSALLIRTVAGACPCDVVELPTPAGFAHAVGVGLDTRGFAYGVAWNAPAPGQLVDAATCRWELAGDAPTPPARPMRAFRAIDRGDFTAAALATTTLVLRSGAMAYEHVPPGEPIHVGVDVACVADIDDGSGTGVPDLGVDVNDLIHYLAYFGAGDPRADVDDAAGTGVGDEGVSIDDLLYFLLRFEGGC